MQVLIALLVILILLFIGLRYLPLIQQNEQYRRRIDFLDAELEKQRQESKQLQEEFNALRNDPKTVERLARQTLGYARADETIFRFDPPVTNAAAR